jgi:colicin import membrane protein
VKLRKAHEPGRIASGALAVLVHLLFFGLLVFGLSWQKKIVNPMVVDLWQDLPEPARKSAPPPVPVPKVVPRPAPPKPVPEVRKEPVVPPPAPKVEIPKPTAAEIELKEKLRKQKEQEEAQRLEEQRRAEAARREEEKKAELEKRRLEDEQRKIAEEKRRAEAEQQRAEAEKRRIEAEEKRRAEAELKRAEAEQRRMEAEQKKAEQERLRKEEDARRAEELKRAEEQRRVEEARREEERRQRAAAAERERQQQEAARKQREAEEARRKAEAAARAAQQKLIDDWRARIQAKIKGRVVVPPNIEGNPEARFDVVLLPGGDVLSATLKKASGNPAYDAAVERAILAAQPLPVPSDTDLFQENFRELTLVFRPKDTDR